jgi:hypothetical protein
MSRRALRLMMPDSEHGVGVSSGVVRGFLSALGQAHAARASEQAPQKYVGGVLKDWIDTAALSLYAIAGRHRHIFGALDSWQPCPIAPTSKLESIVQTHTADLLRIFPVGKMTDDTFVAFAVLIWPYFLQALVCGPPYMFPPG